MRRILPSILGRGQVKPTTPARRSELREARERTQAAKIDLLNNPPDLASQVEQRVAGFQQLQQMRTVEMPGGEVRRMPSIGAAAAYVDRAAAFDPRVRRQAE